MEDAQGSRALRLFIHAVGIAKEAEAGYSSDTQPESAVKFWFKPPGVFTRDVSEVFRSFFAACIFVVG